MPARFDSDGLRRMETLVWLSEKGEGRHSVLPCYLNERGGWRTPDGLKQGEEDLRTLAAQGLIEDTWFRVLDNVCITPPGRAKAHELKRAWGDRQTRLASCRSAILLWLYSHGAYTQADAIKLTDFFLDDYSVFAWKQFPEDEVKGSLARLSAAKLVAEVPARAEPGLYLTPEGLICVEEYDSDLMKYSQAIMKPMPVPTDSGPTINIHGGQVQMATGNYSKQAMHVGPAAEEVLLLVGGVAQLMRGLQLSGEDLSELDHLQRLAEDDLTSPRVRRGVSVGSTTGLSSVPRKLVALP